MKKLLFLLLFSVFVVGAAAIITIKSNPPLAINSYKSFHDNANVRLIEIENKGIRELQLQNIVVNDEMSENAELMISMAQKFESFVPSDPNITYHGIKQLKLFPSRYIDRKAVSKLPQYYGLKINGEDIQKITIHYTYLKIPFTLTAELKTVEKNT